MTCVTQSTADHLVNQLIFGARRGDKKPSYLPCLLGALTSNSNRLNLCVLSFFKALKPKMYWFGTHFLIFTEVFFKLFRLT